MNKGFELVFRNTLNLAFKKQCRTFLSQAYYCEDVWRSRLEDKLVKEIKPVNFYYELVRKYKKEGRVSAIEVDLFMNSIHDSGKEKLVEEMEEILTLLRRSPESIRTLPSTPHAVIRHLVKLNQTDLLLKMISDPTNYGIFPCYYLINLLMDNFLKKKNFTACARIASILMLQEDYGTPLTRALALSSCIQYILNQDNCDPWVDYNPVVEPEEEIKIKVNFLRNPYFDDHFDLKNPKHIVGKTLAWMSPCLESQLFKSNAEILGWGLYQKWSNLDEALCRVKETNDNICQNVVTLVSMELEDCEDEKLKGSIEKHFSDFKNDSRISDQNLKDLVENLVKENVEKFEETDIKQQCDIYTKWSDVRQQALDQEFEEKERRELISQIEEKKKYLEEKEEVLFFFDNKLKLELKYTEKMKIKQETKQEEEEYVPPEIRKEY